MVPIAILLSIILPGNKVILFADLAVIPFVVALFAPIMKGNIVRMIVAGTLELLVGFYIASGMAPFFTQTATDAGFKMPANAVKITSIADGFLWPNWLFTRLTQALGGVFGLLVLLALVVVGFVLLKAKPATMEKLAGAPDEVAEEEVAA